MVIQSTTKQDSFNCSLKYPTEYSNIMEQVRQEAKKIFNDSDCIIICSYFLIKDTLKNVKLYLKNDYARQLKSELKQALKVK